MKTVLYSAEFAFKDGAILQTADKLSQTVLFKVLCLFFSQCLEKGEARLADARQQRCQSLAVP